MTGQPQLTWTVEPHDDVAVVHVTGEIDLASQNDFDDALRQAAATEAPVIVVDLTDVGFMGSVGLRVLVEAQNLLSDSGRAIRIVDGAGIARRSLEIAGLQVVMPIFTVVADARTP